MERPTWGECVSKAEQGKLFEMPVEPGCQTACTVCGPLKVSELLQTHRMDSMKKGRGGQIHSCTPKPGFLLQNTVCPVVTGLWLNKVRKWRGGSEGPERREASSCMSCRKDWSADVGCVSKCPQNSLHSNRVKTALWPNPPPPIAHGSSSTRALLSGCKCSFASKTHTAAFTVSRRCWPYAEAVSIAVRSCQITLNGVSFGIKNKKGTTGS